MDNFVYTNDDGKLIYDGAAFSDAIKQLISTIDDINALWWLRSEMNVTLDARFAERTDNIIYSALHPETSDEIDEDK